VGARHEKTKVFVVNQSQEGAAAAQNANSSNSPLAEAAQGVHLRSKRRSTTNEPCAGTHKCIIIASLVDIIIVRAPEHYK